MAWESGCICRGAGLCADIQRNLAERPACSSCQKEGMRWVYCSDISPISQRDGMDAPWRWLDGERC